MTIFCYRNPYSQQYAISKVFGESKVVCELLTALGVVPNPTLFKGQLYGIH